MTLQYSLVIHCIIILNNYSIKQHDFNWSACLYKSLSVCPSVYQSLYIADLHLTKAVRRRYRPIIRGSNCRQYNRLTHPFMTASSGSQIWSAATIMSVRLPKSWGSHISRSSVHSYEKKMIAIRYFILPLYRWRADVLLNAIHLARPIVKKCIYIIVVHWRRWQQSKMKFSLDLKEESVKVMLKRQVLNRERESKC